MLLANKVALITGAGSGIGRATAHWATIGKCNCPCTARHAGSDVTNSTGCFSVLSAKATK